MRYSEIVDVILRTNPNEAWKRITTDEKSTFVHLGDVNLRIECSNGPEGVHLENFREDWANGFPDSRASSQWVNVLYGSTLVDRKIHVHVDGARASLPLPAATTKVVDSYSFAIARICDQTGTLNEYMRRAGLSMSD